MRTATKRSFTAAVLAAAMLAGGAGLAPNAAMAQDDRGWRSGERGWSGRDVDRYGREQFERGYRMGREEERRYRGGERRRDDAQRWEREEDERGFRMRGEEERRYGRRDEGGRYGFNRGEGEDEGWFSGGDFGLFD